MINREKTQSNKVKREVCDNIKKALRNRKVDDATIKQFEEIFWNETQGYSFSRDEAQEKDLQKIEKCTFRVNSECGHTASCKICGALGGN